MNLNLLGLRTVIYPSSDLTADTAWWSQLLRIEPYFAEPFYVGFNVAGYELGLLPDGDPADGAQRALLGVAVGERLVRVVARNARDTR